MDAHETADTARIWDATDADVENTSAEPQPQSGPSGNGNLGTPTPTVAERRWFILEPAVFFMFLARFLSGAVFQNQILYQTCITVYNYNETQCYPLLGKSIETPAEKSIEETVQSYVAEILMARSLLESIVPALLSLFIGPWSDKFGRRPVVLTTFSGFFFYYVILTLMIFTSTKTMFSPWLYLLASLPVAFSGGTCAIITGIYCYIADVAKEKARAFRMVLNEASLCGGMMIGSVASGYIYAATDVLTMFFLSTGAMLAALVYCYLFVVESLKPEQIPTGSKIRAFFRIDLVKDLIRTCFQPRVNYDRAIIWLTITALTIAVFTMEGDGNVIYLFIIEKFDWTLKQYSLYGAARIIVQIVGSVFGMILLRKVMKFSIITMTLIAFGSSVLESTVRAFAVYSWELYLGLAFGLMRGILGPMSRALLSHMAPASEVGKIFAITTSLESLSPLIAAPLYTQVYKSTLTFFPGLFNLITAGLYLLCYGLIAVIYGIQKSMGDTVAYKAIGS